jgi:hypothetical protein
MSIQVQHFDDTGAEKALKECPKLVRDYVKKLKESNKHWQKLCGMAINKLKKASKNNCDLPVVSNNEVAVCNCSKPKYVLNEHKQTLICCGCGQQYKLQTNC